MTENTDAEGNVETTRMLTDNRIQNRVGAQPQSSGASAPELGAGALSDSGILDFGPAQSAVDPILQVNLQTGLHQYYVAQNAYINHAVDACSESDAWLVRLRVTVQPHARNQPYDVYTRIFFATENGFNGARLPLTDTVSSFDVIPVLLTDNMERSDTRRMEQALAQLQAGITGARPLFGFGAGVERQLEALNAVFGNQYNNLLSVSRPRGDMVEVRHGAAFSPSSRYEMQARNYDLHLLVVRPASEASSSNKLFIRALTTMRHAETGEALPTVPDRHDPDGALLDLADSVYEYVLRREWAGSDEGSSIDQRGSARKEARAARNQVLNMQTLSFSEVEELYIDVFGAGEPNQELFAAFIRVHAALDGTVDEVTLPAPLEYAPPYQVGVFTDNPASGLTVQLAGAGAIRSEQVAAALVVAPERSDGLAGGRNDTTIPVVQGFVSRRSNGDHRNPIEEFLNPLNASRNSAEQLFASRSETSVLGPFYASATRVGSSGDLQLTFPSLSAMGIDPTSRALSAIVDASGASQCRESSGESLANLIDRGVFRVYPLAQNRVTSQAVQPGAIPISFRARLVSSTPNLEDSKGSVRVVISGIDGRSNANLSTYSLSLVGAELASGQQINDDGSVPENGTVTVLAAQNALRVPAGAGVYQLEFEDVPSDGKFKIVVQGLNSSAQAISQERVELNVEAVRPGSES